VSTPGVLDGFPPNPLHERLGIVVTEATPNRVVATMPVAGNEQPFGMLHGGASVALAEGLGSIGSYLQAGPGSMIAGVDINATHHRPARSGLVTGTATPLHVGRSVATWAVDIVDEAGERICTARITCAIRPPT
jgi:1,4-dihydroxy-2-naphthoyl-CoA hydrolase